MAWQKGLTEPQSIIWQLSSIKIKFTGMSYKNLPEYHQIFCLRDLRIVIIHQTISNDLRKLFQKKYMTGVEGNKSFQCPNKGSIRYNHLSFQGSNKVWLYNLRSSEYKTSKLIKDVLYSIQETPSYKIKMTSATPRKRIKKLFGRIKFSLIVKRIYSFIIFFNEIH